MNAAAQHRFTYVLMSGAVLLAGLWLALLLGLGRHVQWAPPRALAPLAVPTRAVANAPLLPPAAFASVWQQSLFSPDRKPEAHAANGGSSLGDLELTGVIVTPQLRMALLRERKSGAELRLREGQRLPDGSLGLVEVKARSAILDTPQGRVEMKLPAGAPIDIRAAPAKGAPPSAANQPAGAAEVRRVTAMGRAAAPTAPPQYNSQQVERLRRLKAAILQRRAASQAASAEGAH